MLRVEASQGCWRKSSPAGWACLTTPRTRWQRTATNSTGGVMATLQVIYQVWRSTDSCGEFYSWEDVDEEEYNESEPNKRRAFYNKEEVDAIRMQFM